jgi:hypothetical protein
MVAVEGNEDYGLDEEDTWFIKATVGCKWGMTAQRLFIPLIASFHLSEILGGRAREMWHALCGFCFLLVPALVNAPFGYNAGGPTLTHCGRRRPTV